MMRITPLTVALAVGLLLSGCAGDRDPQNQIYIDVDQSFSTASGAWTVPGRMVVAAKIVAFSGQEAVCGVWMQENNRNPLDDSIAAMLRLSQVRDDAGSVRIKDLTYFTPIPPRGRLSGVPARCRLTGRVADGGEVGTNIVLFALRGTEPGTPGAADPKRRVRFLPGEPVPGVL